MLPAPSRKADCKSCRERKVICDKKKPSCTACMEANRPCGGYDLGQFFINMSSQGPPPSWSRSQHAQKYLVVDLASQPSRAEQPHVPFTDVSTISRPSSVAPNPWTLPTFPNPDPTNIHGISSLFLDLYYRRFTPNTLSSNSLQPGMECGGWRSLLTHWIGESTILDTAIGAMSACFIGTQYQDDNLMDQGNNMYLNALQMVQQALPESNSAKRRDLLATTLVMSSIEIFMSNGGGGSQLTHIDGATRLLRLVFDHQNFEELHIYILNQGLFEAISTRRRYEFSSASYRPLIRRLYSCPRTFRNDLYFQWTELILPLPNILAAVDDAVAAANSGNPAPPSAINAILDDLAVLEQSLAPWYESLKTNMHGPWTFQNAHVSAEGVPYPLQFVSIEVCTLYNLHWMSQLLLLEAESTLLSHLQNPVPAHLHPQIFEYSSMICRSVQYCTSNTSFAAAESMFLPLFAVTSYYARVRDEERMKWCVSCFTRISQEQRIGFSFERLNFAEGTVNEGGSRRHSVWDEA
ncbi:hypothetical protein EJ04DRAFT_554273 [Polyplosphaeria fusca]|uniref:Zn(2)-C6 fungal-type domain-containing protein n=1 Tax=Polyplosphaeria fusca TaxID=682080 RepID=A0A9P4QVP1_9PLEO|nr:hypothetical protein EJ04DRAFT_554273 [Polyplosphaeria fusca]